MAGAHGRWRGQTGAVLTIDLAALVANWRQLAAFAAPAECAAVVKADAYGLGLAPAVGALADAGCKTFFVAHFGEAMAVRRCAPAVRIFLLHGAPLGGEADLIAAGIVPVVSTGEQVAAWRSASRAANRPAPAAIHIDTGMNRLGISAAEAENLAADATALRGFDVVLVMSHLACAEERHHPLNAEQLTRFRRLRRLFPAAPASLANSAGTLLGRDFHFDLVRPGIALYGLDVLDDSPVRMNEVVQLQGRILQVRSVDRGMTVGYGATHFVAAPGRLATVAVGYADGYFRSLSNRGYGYIDDIRVPIAGRVSMDLITLDVSAVPPERAQAGTMVTLIGGAQPLGAVAATAGTIPYELLTRLGQRFERVYRATDRGTAATDGSRTVEP